MGYEVANTRSCITPSLSKGLRDASQAGIRAYPHPKVGVGYRSGTAPDSHRTSPVFQPRDDAQPLRL